MAVGRQDYQAGVVPIKSGYSLSQSDHFKWYNYDRPAGGNVDFCTFTVPTGYELHICGYRIISELPFLHYYEFRVDASQIFGGLFYSQIIDNFPAEVVKVVTAGQTFKIVVHNNDSITVKFYALVLGFLEQIES